MFHHISSDYPISHLVLPTWYWPGSPNSNRREHAGRSHVAMNPMKRSVVQPLQYWWYKIWLIRTKPVGTHYPLYSQKSALLSAASWLDFVLALAEVACCVIAVCQSRYVLWSCVLVKWWKLLVWKVHSPVPCNNQAEFELRLLRKDGWTSLSNMPILSRYYYHHHHHRE